MKPFTHFQERVLLVLSIFGLIVPNGIFLYHSLVHPEALRVVLGSPIAMVFVVEAFLLMFLCAWLIRRWGLRAPGPLGFIVLSLLGSLLFSVPAVLYLASRRARRSGPQADGVCAAAAG